MHNKNTTASGAADSPKLRLLLDSFPEQNPRNFDPDAAIQLNEWGIAIVEELYRLRTLAASAPVAPTPEGFVQAPHYRGYANLGTGQYLLNHTAPHEPAELIISIASDEDKAGRTIGDDRGNPAGKAIQPDEMAVRLAFTSVAGLDALEKQLRYLREVHFPQAAPVAPAPPSFQSLFDKMQADPGHDALRADVLAGGNGAPLQQGEYLPLPIGEGTVYCNPDGSLMIDASLAFFDGAKIGDKLYTADQVCAAIDADRAARGAAQAAPAPVAEDAEDGARFRAMVNAVFTGFEEFERIMHAAAETEPETIDDFRALVDKARAKAAQPEGGA